MPCPRCHQPSLPDAQYCVECGAPLTAVCAGCGETIAVRHKFCPDCGHPTKAAVPRAFHQLVPDSYTPKPLAEKILTARSSMEGARKQVTVLLADMKGYTPFAATIGEEAVYELMKEVYEIMLNAVHQHEGTVQSLTGDGVLALFGAPVAVEDAPLRACRAALDIQSRMTDLNKEHQRLRGVVPKVRIGINTGPVVVGTVGTNLHMEFKAIGNTVNLAAHLEAAAEPGTILLSEATHRLVEGFGFEAVRETRKVKGRDRPLPVYQLESLETGTVRFDAAKRRGLTPLVGRERELATIEWAYKQACRGEAHVVNLRGEPGIGKSRIIHEFRARLRDDPAVFHLGHSTIDGRSIPFLPFLEIFRSMFEVADEDEQKEVERKLARGLQRLRMEVAATMPFLLNLFGLAVEGDGLRGLDGAVVGARTSEVLRDVIRAECRLAPLVLVIDDLHWTDSASEALITRLAQSSDRVPLLMLFSYRPEYQPQWAGRPDVTEVHLEPLSAQETSELSQRRLGRQVPPLQMQMIVEKAGGNPLFAEEITHYLLESGALRESAERSELRPGVLSIPVPDTLRDLLMSRFDRRESKARQLLQVASVIGRRFPLEVLREVAGIDGAVHGIVKELEEHELIVPKEARHGREYEFKHVLIQDAIYQSLLKSQREELHQKVGECLERMHHRRLSEYAELLAYHYGRSERRDKAVQYLALAGERSLKLYSLEEADQYYRQLVGMIESDPHLVGDTFLADRLRGWVFVYYYRKDFLGLIELFERYRPRVEALEDPRRLSLHLSWLGLAHAANARGDVAKAYLDKALALGEQVGDDECIGHACMGLLYQGLVQQGTQPPETFRDLANRALAVSERSGSLWLAAKVLNALTLCQLGLGRYSEGRRTSIRTIELGLKAGDRRTEALGLWQLGFADVFDERFEDAIANAEESYRLSRDALDKAAARGVKGSALALMGRGKEGLDLLQDVRRESIASGFALLLLGIDIPCGVAMFLAGQMSRGERWIQDAIERFTGWGNRTLPAFGHLVLGEIYLQMLLGERRLPSATLLRNLGFLLRTLPLAHRRAKRHLETAVRMAREAEVAGTLVRSLLNLGLLHQAKRRPVEAQRCLDEALALAERHDLSVLREKVAQARQGGKEKRPAVH